MREQSALSLAESDSNTPTPAGHTARDPLTCTICGKTYSRIDHLERHSRSHSQIKPFACSTCGKAFARVDALKRHEGNHDDGSSVKRRKTSHVPNARTGQACQSCAASKLRCDDEKPCARCKRKGITCTSAKAATATQRNYDGSMSPSRRERHSYGQATNHHFTIATTDNGLSIDVDVPSPMSPQRGRPGHESRRNLSQAPEHSSNSVDQNGALSVSATAPQTQNVQAFSPDVPNMFGESSLAEFLNDVMLPPLPGPEELPLPDAQGSHMHATRDFLDFGTSWLDFVEIDALLNAEVGLKPNNHVSFRPVPPSGNKTPLFGQSFAQRNAAFSRSIWQWEPTKKDHGGAQQLNLSLPLADMNSPETRSLAGTILPGQHIDQTVRDRILALILSTCDKSMYSDVVSSFPSCDLLNALIHHYLNTQYSQIDSWLHIPTFSIDDQELELLISIIAAGAVISTSSAVRKLGFALHESARQALAEKFESDNRFTRNIACIQALAICLQIGLWSGDKRKMEIAESFLQPPITMLRRSGRFSRSKSHVPSPTLDDSEDTLQSKWRDWVNAESYKRLAIHFLIHAAQNSMALQIPLLLSPAEITLDLPASKDLWCSSTAEAWRNAYLRNAGASTPEKSLSISQSISHVSMIRDQPGIDVPLSAMIAVHSVWSAVWSDLHFNALVTAHTPSHTASEILVVSNSWDSGLLQLLARFHLVFSDWNEFRPQMALVLERILLNMHISFEQVQLLAGKEGEEEARRVLPLLQRWSATSDARRAVWHAGQVLKAARQCPQRHLRDFEAVCLYHAGMTFWSYAIVSASVSDQQDGYGDHQTSRSRPHISASELVWLDGDDCPAVQRFIALNRGTPVVCGPSGESDGRNMFPITLENPKAIMNICIELLRGNSPMEVGCTPLPLVENLSQLMQDLGIAAQELLQGGLRRAREPQTTS